MTPERSDETPIFTGRYQNRRLASGLFVAVPISLGLPRWKLRYPLEGKLGLLCPSWSYLRSPRPVYEQKYLSGLAKIGVDRIGFDLDQYARSGMPAVLLCFEDLREPGNWCHRRLFADWWREQTGHDIPELDEEDQVAMF
jgi:hypothetical protein